MTIDLTLSPIYRIGGQEISSLPGLVALTPPQTAARGRERDRLIAYLLLTGNSTFSTSEYTQVAADAANAFYKTPGALTTALKAAAEKVNTVLLERNMTTSKSGQFAVGWLTLAAVRESQCTLALSGPMHVHWFGHNETKHIHEPATSGRGLGTNQTTSVYYSQTSLNAGDRLLFLGRAPEPWSNALDDPTPGSLDAMRRRLISLSNADLNAVLIQATDGKGVLNLLGTSKPEAEKKEEPVSLPPQLVTDQPAESTPSPFDEAQDAAPLPAHIVQPSAYAIPPQVEEEAPLSAARPLTTQGVPRTTASRDFPASIPRLQPGQTLPAPVEPTPPVTEDVEETSPSETVVEPVREQRPPRLRRRDAARPEWTRQVAKALAGGIQLTRRVSGTIGDRLKVFLPRLLPNTETSDTVTLSTATMFFMAVLIPLMVVTILSVVYLRYGQSQQYDTYLARAKEMRTEALTYTNPVEQRKAWENVLSVVKTAESHRQTPETETISAEANAKLDELFGITRMQFNPAFSASLGVEISRMAASETDFFLLDAVNGGALHAQPSPNGRGFQIDETFICKPGVYGNYTVGHLVDILTLPPVNSINATLLGIDAAGNLLYCAPGQVAMAVPLPPPDTNWGHVTAFTISNGNLYVLDAPASAVWVYNGKDGTFVDRPYFFFGGQTPEKKDVIDLVVLGDDLYMLHADGHLSKSTYNRIDVQSQRYLDPIPLINPFSAYQDMDLFASANLTQMLVTALPNQSILLLDADAQSILRFTPGPQALELQSQFRPTMGATPVSAGPVGALAVSPNHVLYLAVNGQVYFAVNMP